ncbi:hypothetical protein [Actinocrinis puniceicyclus]|nr:hypothetical protein [Actinocrinis puniceicyclus]
MTIDALDKTGVSVETPQTAPRFSRAVLALIAAATVAVAPVAGPAFAPAGSGRGAHSSPVYLFAQFSHDIGHNDWAFQGGVAGRVDWVVSYLALGAFWLAVALWIRVRAGRAARRALESSALESSALKSSALDTSALNGRTLVTAAGADTPRGVIILGGSRRRGLWLRVLAAAWVTQAAAGLLTLGAGLAAAWTSSALGPLLLRAADLCSPWWSCVAVLAAVASAELNAVAFRTAACYGVLLTLLLLVPIPGPGIVKVLMLAVIAAVPAVLPAAAPIVTRRVAVAD